jgi:preprotein translocase subunit SecA
VIADYLGSILPEAIALHVRACELIHGKVFTLQDGREFTWNMLPYDVQIIGALCLHE